MFSELLNAAKTSVKLDEVVEKPYVSRSGNTAQPGEEPEQPGGNDPGNNDPNSGND